MLDKRKLNTVDYLWSRKTTQPTGPKKQPGGWRRHLPTQRQPKGSHKAQKAAPRPKGSHKAQRQPKDSQRQPRGSQKASSTTLREATLPEDNIKH